MSGILAWNERLQRNLSLMRENTARWIKDGLEDGSLSVRISRPVIMERGAKAAAIKSTAGKGGPRPVTLSRRGKTVMLKGSLR